MGKATSCYQCRKTKKGCTKEPGGCSGCRIKGVPCIYPSQTVKALGASKVACSATLSPQLPNNRNSEDALNFLNTPDWDSVGNSIRTPSSEISATAPLKQFITAIEAPISFDNYHDDWMIQDPDLMPTWRDFECVNLFFTNMSRNHLAAGMMDSFDVSTFLLTFFQQPPSFRLVITAISAFYLGASTSEESYLFFFKRARKAVILAANRPSVSTAKAYFWIFVCSKIMSKTELGLPFLVMSVEMLKILEIDRDPDDLPWLRGLHLTEIEMEERRRLYWNVKLMLDLERSLSLELGLPELSFGYVKPMRAIAGTFRNVDSCQPFCDIRELIIAIKKHHLLVPRSLQEIFLSPAVISLHLWLSKILSDIPSEYLLRHGTDLKRVESTYNPVTALYLVWMNFDLLASVVMLHRSKLYLSALDCFEPSRLDSVTHETIKLAINETLYATQNMIYCVSLLMNLNEQHRRGITMRMELLYPIFEATISAWFLTCRMSGQWRSLVPIPFEDLQNGVAQFLIVGQTTKEGRGGEILPVMKAMLQEMTACDVEPLAFMGLLGLQVKGGKGWQGRKEERWRVFWKGNGLK
ncbi:hypothetical protein HDU99_003792 [Rhizoclosmatium hyalinum]|nr:hypothetical protein HDU99_003792 [Rhizoclosmatium hyalinum]